MSTNEIRAIKQSMSDGYYQGYGKHPRESEIEVCLRFFEQVDIVRTKEPENINHLEMQLLGVFYAVMDRQLLISGYDIEQGPQFVTNEIVKH